MSIECNATFEMEPPQLGRSSRSRGVCFICQHVSIILNDIPFNKRYFAIKLETRLNFEISRVFFAPMNTKVCRSNLSPWTFYNGTRHPLLACVLLLQHLADFVLPTRFFSAGFEAGRVGAGVERSPFLSVPLKKALLKGFSVTAPFAGGVGGPPVRAPHPMGDYRVVLSEAGIFLAIQATGYVYGTGRRERHGPARRRGSIRVCVIRHREAV